MTIENIDTWRLLQDDFEAEEHYRSNPRNDVVDLIRRAPQLVIDLGCGTGITGALIKQRFPSATIVGIEPHARSAEEASKRIDRVLAGRFEDIDLAQAGFEPGSVDLVIAADVLEHIYNPWQALLTLHQFLAHDAIVLASIPNIRNLDLIEKLVVGGRWEYASEGLLDVTHIRFFTKSEILAMFAQTGFGVRRYIYRLDPYLKDYYYSTRSKRPINVTRGRFTFENLSDEEFKEVCALQILIEAVPNEFPI